MESTKYFTIDEGQSAGVFCAYCGKRIKPQASENQPISYKCDCSNSCAEVVLIKEKEKADRALDLFYSEMHDTMVRNELLRKLNYHEEVLVDIKQQLNILLHQPKPAGDPLYSISDVEQLTQSKIKEIID